MFEGVGKKIKGLAILIFVIGLISSVIWGITTLLSILNFSEGGLYSLLAILAGLAVTLIGIIGSWASVLLLYGFGELIDKTCDTYEDVHSLKKAYLKTEEQDNPANTYKCSECGETVISGERFCKNCGVPLKWE